MFEEIKLEIIRNLHYKPSPKPDLLNLLVKLLIREYDGNKDAESDVSITWKSILTDICNHQDENGNSYPFFALDVTLLLEKCYNENPEVAKDLFQDICKKNAAVISNQRYSLPFQSNK